MEVGAGFCPVSFEVRGAGRRVLSRVSGGDLSVGLACTWSACSRPAALPVPFPAPALSGVWGCFPCSCPHPQSSCPLPATRSSSSSWGPGPSSVSWFLLRTSFPVCSVTHFSGDGPMCVLVHALYACGADEGRGEAGVPAGGVPVGRCRFINPLLSRLR